MLEWDNNEKSSSWVHKLKMPQHTYEAAEKTPKQHFEGTHCVSSIKTINKHANSRHRKEMATLQEDYFHLNGKGKESQNHPRFGHHKIFKGLKLKSSGKSESSRLTLSSQCHLCVRWSWGPLANRRKHEEDLFIQGTSALDTEMCVTQNPYNPSAQRSQIIT
jgi:hypothetical protein